MEDIKRLFAEIVHTDTSLFHVRGRGSESAFSDLQAALEGSAFEIQSLRTSPYDLSTKAGLIEAFVEKQVPADWQKWPIDRRRDYWYGATRTPDGQELELVDRDRISAVEVWCELFNGNIKDMKPADTREINAILARLKEWRRSETVIRVGPYSVQRGFVRR